MSKFTKGPWIIEGQTDPFAYITAGGMVVARSGSRDEGSLGEHAANARLIAAAPDLYAACERFVKNGVCTCADGGEGFVCDFCEGKAALTKATP